MPAALKVAIVAVVCVVLLLSVGYPASAGSCVDCYHGCRNRCDAKADADCSRGLLRGRSEAECVGCKLRSYYACKETCDRGCSGTCDKVLLGLSSVQFS